MGSDGGKYWDKPLSWVDGCTPVSAGCANCWSKAMADRFGRVDFSKVVIRPDRLSIPAKTRKPTVFSVWNDLFHEDVPDEFIFKAIDEMEANERHTFLVLTKRAERMAEILRGDPTLRDHIWHGISAENQGTLDERLPHLLCIPGNRFLSLEPLLGPIDLPWENRIHWIVVGGETGPHKRECKPEWINSIIEYGRMSRIPVWVKSAPAGVEIVRNKPFGG